VSDNHSKIIYNRPKTAVDVNNAQVTYIDTNYAFMPFKGWIPNGKEGFIGKKGLVQYTFQEALDAFDEQYQTKTNNDQRLGLFLAVANYVLMLAKNKDYVTPDDVETLKEALGQASRLVAFSNDPNSLKMILFNLYYGDKWN
jgi:hypothetical protein